MATKTPLEIRRFNTKWKLADSIGRKPATPRASRSMLLNVFTVQRSHSLTQWKCKRCEEDEDDIDINDDDLYEQMTRNEGKGNQIPFVA